MRESFGKCRVKEGDEIIITEMEHHSNLVPWQQICKRNNAVLKIISFDKNGILRTEVINTLITEKTRLIALTHVSNVLGTVNPVKEIISHAHAGGVPVLVDGAQAVQHMAIDVLDLDCDFYVFSGHKMYAETGIGVLFGKENWLDLMPPCQTGGGMVSSVSFKETSFADLPFKFEAGTPNIAGGVSIHAAIDFMEKAGMNNIDAHEQELITYALDKLNSIEGIKIYGPGVGRRGVVSFNLQNTGPYDAAMVLDKLGIAVRSGTHCAEPVMKHFGVRGTVRASFALYNTKEEIDILADGIHKVQKMFN